MVMSACRQSAQKPVTLSYFRLGWAHADVWSAGAPLSQKFTRETGIQLKDLPVPENALDQLDLSRTLLKSSSGPDVLSIDLISSGVLAPDLVDLRPYLAAEISSIEPKLLPGYTVEGKVVAIPNSVQVGALEYRADLLRENGYRRPPKTWHELELMASRIQAGERAKGKKDFWGYVWQGASAEALTCNALEWQFAEGGGHFDVRHVEFRYVEFRHLEDGFGNGDRFGFRFWGRGGDSFSHDCHPSARKAVSRRK